MKKIAFFTMCIVGFCAGARADDFDSDRLNNWHQWRGPEATGVAPLADPPIHWDENTNIKWKVDIPGRGSATPIVWGDQVFVVTAVAVGGAGERPRGLRGRLGFGGGGPRGVHQFVVMSLDRETGDVRWQKTAREEIPHEGTQQNNTYASSSPTTDGRYLYASFGSRGIYCYDLTGNLIWERDLGDMRTRLGFGEGVSPVLYGDRLIVNWDHEGQSSIFVLNAETGETLWEVERDDATAWATPLVIEHAGTTQVITNATKRTRSYDLSNGRLIWENGGQVNNAIPSPVALDGIVYAMSGYRGSALYAIPLSSTGDLTGTDKVAWHLTGGTPYVPSPLLYGDLLYFTGGNRTALTCVDARTGEVLLKQERLPDVREFYASPVGASDRIYFVDRDGTALVLKRGPQVEVLATNRLDVPIDASPAIAGKEIFLRGGGKLYSIAAE